MPATPRGAAAESTPGPALPPAAAESAARHRRAREIFLDALERPAVAREPFLEATCAGNPGLLAEVMSLLEFAPPEDERPAAPAALVPTTNLLGRYRVGERRDPEGEAGCWDGWDLTEDLPVTILVLPRSATPLGEKDWPGLELRHPHLPSRLAGGVADDSPFVVVDRLTGEPLSKLLGGRGTAPLHAATIARGIALALAALHARGRVHGSVSAASIRVEPSGRSRLTPPATRPPASAAPADDVRSLLAALEPLLAIGAPAPALVGAVAAARIPGVVLPNALALAASLPGGDPIEAARLTGIAPPPALLAVAGRRPRFGLALLVPSLAAAAAAAAALPWIARGDEVFSARGAIAAGLFAGLLLALEPLARRFSPRRLVAWNRLLRGRRLDRLVAEELAVGAAAGLVVAVIGAALPPARIGTGAEILAAAVAVVAPAAAGLLASMAAAATFLATSIGGPEAGAVAGALMVGAAAIGMIADAKR